MNEPIPSDYPDFLSDIKRRIQSAQTQAAMALSREGIWLYWQVGSEIASRFGQHGWGAKIVDRLASDLKAAFPGVEGFSPRNLRYMRTFAEAYPDASILQQLLQDLPLPWGHWVRLLDKGSLHQSIIQQRLGEISYAFTSFRIVYIGRIRLLRFLCSQYIYFLIRKRRRSPWSSRLCVGIIMFCLGLFLRQIAQNTLQREQSWQAILGDGFWFLSFLWFILGTVSYYRVVIRKDKPTP